MTTTYTVRPLFDLESSTWTYILTDKATKKAVIIDPVLEQVERDHKLLKEMGVELVYILETHIHADHITGASALQDITGADIIYGEPNEVEGPIIFVEDGETLTFGKTKIKVMATPGHTDGCTSYYLDGAVFTGDTLLIRGCGRTDFQSGAASALYKSINEKIFTLPEGTIIYPAHDYKGMLYSTVEEEKGYNLRVSTGTAIETFVEIMDNLNLPHPKKITEAVPANKKAGRIS